MKKTLTIILVTLACTAHAKDEPKVTYVGLGQYSCVGNSAACAQVNANNRAADDSFRRRMQEQQNQTDRYIQDNRRREQEQNDRQRYR